VKQTVSRRRLAGGLAVMALAAAVYTNTLRHPPVWDDHVFVFGQAFLRQCGNLARVADPRAFTGVLAARNAARPVWLASILVDTCLGGGYTFAYRLTSLFWHAAGAAVVMALAWSLAGDAAAALAAGLLFAVHPVHAEAVNILTFRADLLCLAWLGAAVLAYRAAGRLPPRKSAWAWAAALGCASAALLSKEMAVTLPLLLLLGDACFPKGAPSRAARAWALAAACLLVAGYLVFRAPRSGYAMRSWRDAFTELGERIPLPFSQPLSPEAAPSAAASLVDDPPWRRVYHEPRARFWTMSEVFGSYLRLLAWPRTLQGDYAPRVVDRPTAAGLASWLAWTALVAAAWRRRAKLPLAAYGALWTAATLLPVTGLISIRNLQAERYLYVPSAGLCLAAGALFAALYRRREARGRQAAAAALILVVAAGAARTFARNADFASDRAFFDAVLRADDKVPGAHLGLALLEADAGNRAAADAEFRTTLALWPDSVRTRELYARFAASAR
jgi:protein O-mannosyl-transferase